MIHNGLIWSFIQSLHISTNSYIYNIYIYVCIFAVIYHLFVHMSCITLNSDGKQLAVGSLDIFHCAMSRTVTAKTCKVDHSNDCFDVGANMILSRLSFVGALDNMMGHWHFFKGVAIVIGMTIPHCGNQVHWTLFHLFFLQPRIAIYISSYMSLMKK